MTTLAPPLAEVKQHVDALHQLLNAPQDTSAWLGAVNTGIERIATLVRPSVPRAPIRRCPECDEPAFGRGELCAACSIAEGAYDEADAKLGAMYEDE